MVEHRGQIKGGKLQMYDKPKFLDAIANMKDGEVLVRVAKQGDPKSRQLERWMHGVAIKMICEETGNEHDVVWGYIKRRFRPTPVFIGNEMLVVGKSTAGASMSLAEQQQLKTQVQAWAASELGINIPDPNEGDLL